MDFIYVQFSHYMYYLIWFRIIHAFSAIQWQYLSSWMIVELNFSKTVSQKHMYACLRACTSARVCVIKNTKVHSFPYSPPWRRSIYRLEGVDDQHGMLSHPSYITPPLVFPGVLTWIYPALNLYSFEYLWDWWLFLFHHAQGHNFNFLQWLIALNLLITYFETITCSR